MISWISVGIVSLITFIIVKFGEKNYKIARDFILPIAFICLIYYGIGSIYVKNIEELIDNTLLYTLSFASLYYHSKEGK